MTGPQPLLRLPYSLDAHGAPLLLPDGADGLLQQLSGRRGAFVPEWLGDDEADAGTALSRIWSAQAGAAIERLRLLPDKLVRECLSTAGVSPRPQRPARAMIAFQPDMKKLTAPLPIAAGFQLTSPRADGGKGEVIWETEDDLVLAALELDQAFAFDGTRAQAIDLATEFKPFGERPQLGAALYLGFVAGGVPGGQLSLGVVPADPGLAAASGGRPGPDRPEPVIRWETLNPAKGFERADVIGDSSDRFTTEGIVRLALRSGWGASVLPQAPTRESLFWLRARLVSGSFGTVPLLQAIVPHAAHAAARQTFHDQQALVLRSRGGVAVSIGKVNVESGSIVVEVDDPVSGTGMAWHEVPSLAGYDGNSRVFTLDSALGLIRFGDGRDGAMLPEGLRYVRLRAFATAAGAESAVAADEITKARKQLPGLAGVSNPQAAMGGTALESDAAAIRHGPALVKARGRAVTASDVAVMALDVAGASITRAWALGGVDATLGGAKRPGTIGVFVIPARRADNPADEPVRAGAAALAAVARHLSGSTGPALARVTVGNPTFHRIRVEASLSCRAGTDLGAAAADVGAALDAYLNPETDGGGQRSWRLGDTIHHNALVRLILGARSDILAVSDMVLLVDGLRRPTCSDITLSSFGLPWPDRHEIKAGLAGSGT